MRCRGLKAWDWILYLKERLYIAYLEWYAWLQQFDSVVEAELKWRRFLLPITWNRSLPF